MSPLRSIIRRGPKPAVLFATAIGIAAISGCGGGGGDDADVDRGRALFTQHCSRCHTLAEAGSASQIGPDLDSAFADSRASGMTDSTIEGVVRDQIANPRSIERDNPLYDQVFMPADLVTGQDANDVAAYVGSVAGVPDIEPPELSPEELFVDRCGSCHTLQAAGTREDVGPDLDEVLPGQDANMIEESIVDPEAQIAQGFESGVMPENLAQTMTPEDLEGLVRFLLQNAGGDGG